MPRSSIPPNTCCATCSALRELLLDSINPAPPETRAVEVEVPVEEIYPPSKDNPYKLTPGSL